MERRLRLLPNQPLTLNQLGRDLVQVWNNIPQGFLNHLVSSMKRRCQACSSLNITTINVCNCRDIEIACKSGEIISIKKAGHLFKSNYSECDSQDLFQLCKNNTNNCCKRNNDDCIFPYTDSELHELVQECSNRTQCSFKQIVLAINKSNCSEHTPHGSQAVASEVEYECIQNDNKFDDDDDSHAIGHIVGAAAGCGLIISCVLVVVIVRKRMKANINKTKLPEDSQPGANCSMVNDGVYTYVTTSEFDLIPQKAPTYEDYNTLSYNNPPVMHNVVESSFYDHMVSGSDDYDHLQQNMTRHILQLPVRNMAPP
ncbi:uncharacterized protein LOC121369951 [Gigantopelta aegis]|uniref:uncharacterized protein LOC121369951 n=1 Tax=Gigantopelta aegis TaxID=1735272 RepID=UPI001B88C218|nr:uncharacterized protein LOC121369951 [Gigantopelta aegis]